MAERKKQVVTELHAEQGFWVRARKDAGKRKDEPTQARPFSEVVTASSTYGALASEPVEMSSAWFRLKMSLTASFCLPSSVWTEIKMLPSRIFAS